VETAISGAAPKQHHQAEHEIQAEQQHQPGDQISVFTMRNTPTNAMNRRIVDSRTPPATRSCPELPSVVEPIGRCLQLVYQRTAHRRLRPWWSAGDKFSARVKRPAGRSRAGHPENRPEQAAVLWWATGRPGSAGSSADEQAARHRPAVASSASDTDGATGRRKGPNREIEPKASCALAVDIYAHQVRRRLPTLDIDEVGRTRITAR